MILRFHHAAGPGPAGVSGAGAAERVPTAEKVQFLSTPAAYPDRPRRVTVKETHMSWVFLAGERVFKLKKPVRYPYLDFSTLAAREANSRTEVRLNARLAPDVYLGVVALTRTPEGALAVGGDGEAVDWLVAMRRLPDDRMLDRVIARAGVADQDLDRLAAVLASFYRGAERSAIAPDAYAERFARDQAVNRDILMRRAFAVDHGRVPVLMDLVERSIAENRALLEERVRSGHVVDGHGDLRPEHICLTDPIAIFDCLEFNRDLRQADPFDELAYLGVECALLGASRIGPALTDRVAAQIGRPRPPERLVRLYTAFRAVLRARLSLAHLLDPVPREPSRWEPLATRYLRLAEGALAGDWPR